ncbi:MAG: TIR domain-containing protein [Gammaproteobacteria bacterium]|nr:TIR domain-containing protein [Gammaproteobacteria bacterium]
MADRTIFLSYRRDDAPGYVSKLEADLERAFGRGRVFRDVQDIDGGTKWKEVIEENLRRAGALILIIGPHWQRIWEARSQLDAPDYVAMELQQARALDLHIIPVTFNGAGIAPDVELGDLSWLRASQTYDISDKQGRWSGDVQGLIRLLENVDGIGPAQLAEHDAPRKGEPPKRGLGKFVWIAVACVLLGALAVFSGDPPSETPSAPTAGGAPGSTTAIAARAPAPSQSTPKPKSPTPASKRNVSGTWQGRDGTLYYTVQQDDTTFTISSPGYANGTGRFIDNMPNKVEVQLQGVGRGEFSLSADGKRIIGWILINGRQEYDTLTRLD